MFVCPLAATKWRAVEPEKPTIGEEVSRLTMVSIVSNDSFSYRSTSQPDPKPPYPLFYRTQSQEWVNCLNECIIFLSLTIPCVTGDTYLHELPEQARLVLNRFVLCDDTLLPSDLIDMDSKGARASWSCVCISVGACGCLLRGLHAPAPTPSRPAPVSLNRTAVPER